MATDEQINAAMNIGAEMLDIDGSLLDASLVQIIYEMMAISTDGDNLQIIAEDTAIEGMSAELYVSALQLQLPSLGFTIGEAGTAELCGQTYQTLDGALETNGVTVYQRYLVRRIGDRMALITASSQSAEGIDALLAGFSPLA